MNSNTISHFMELAMGKAIRLDKYLADMGIGTRTEVKNLLKKGKVTVDGEIIKKPDYKIDTDNQRVCYEGTVIAYQPLEYYMLNKPAGVVSAVTDKRDKTVLDLLGKTNRKDLFPVGRLDKDTEGLLLITNDGALAHNLLSPNKHVSKTYYAKIKGMVTEQDREEFKNGIYLNPETEREKSGKKDKIKTLSSELTILSSDEISEVLLTIKEGKYHQVKRMFYAVGKKVIYLKRLSMGSLKLDKTLNIGDYRSLTKEEIEQLEGRK